MDKIKAEMAHYLKCQTPNVDFTHDQIHFATKFDLQAILGFLVEQIALNRFCIGQLERKIEILERGDIREY